MMANNLFQQIVYLCVKRFFRFGVLAFILSLPILSAAATTVQPLSSAIDESANTDERWLVVKQQVLGDIDIQDGSALISLEAPKRAYDAALVPISVKALQAQTDKQYIKELYLFADKNPAPMAGKFMFKPDTGWQSIETRIRVNEYTYVRAVAITNKDKAYMVSRYVKASGGCSAPALGDAEAALANVGKFKLKLDSSAESGIDQERMQLNFQIKHPNNSGMQFDQISRLYIPAYFIHTIGVKYNGEEIIKVETNFSMSENPSLRFDFIPEKAGGQIDIYAVDSKDNHFEQQWSS
jgi:sulfur-oxidizing protein SoxY